MTLRLGPVPVRFLERLPDFRGLPEEERLFLLGYWVWQLSRCPNPALHAHRKALLAAAYARGVEAEMAPW